MLDGMNVRRIVGCAGLAGMLAGCNLFFSEGATDANPTKNDAPLDGAQLDANAVDAAAEFPLSNGATWDDLNGALASELILSTDTTIDADTGAISGAVNRPRNTTATTLEVSQGIGFRQVGQVGILSVKKLVVSGKVAVVGKSALLILADDSVTIESIGSIDVSKFDGMRARSGQGGSVGATGPSGATGCGAGSSGIMNSGGGGGGLGTLGGKGGGLSAGLGGPACRGFLHNELLFGSGGGAALNGAATSICGGAGGESGGALQISARNTITMAGTLLANGHGGYRSKSGAGCSSSAGGGGGSGGGILLEAPSIVGPSIIGVGGIFANGGAGASSQVDGGNGLASLMPALGGSNNGGNGGTVGTDAGAGLPGPNNTGGNGGGGAVGAIEFHTRVTTTSITSSPTATFVMLP